MQPLYYTCSRGISPWGVLTDMPVVMCAVGGQFWFSCAVPLTPKRGHFMVMVVNSYVSFSGSVRH